MCHFTSITLIVRIPTHLALLPFVSRRSLKFHVHSTVCVCVCVGAPFSCWLNVFFIVRSLRRGFQSLFDCALWNAVKRIIKYLLLKRHAMYTENGNNIKFCAGLSGPDFEEIFLVRIIRNDDGIFATFFQGNGIWIALTQKSSCRLALLTSSSQIKLLFARRKKIHAHKHTYAKGYRKCSSLNGYLSVLSILAPICVIFHNVDSSAFFGEFCVCWENVTLCTQSIIDRQKNRKFVVFFLVILLNSWFFRCVYFFVSSWNF